MTITADVIVLRIPRVVREERDEDGGVLFIDKDGDVVGGISKSTYPDLNQCPLPTGAPLGADMQRRMDEFSRHFKK